MVGIDIDTRDVEPVFADQIDRSGSVAAPNVQIFLSGLNPGHIQQSLGVLADLPAMAGAVHK